MTSLNLLPLNSSLPKSKFSGSCRKFLMFVALNFANAKIFGALGTESITENQVGKQTGTNHSNSGTFTVVSNAGSPAHPIAGDETDAPQVNYSNKGEDGHNAFNVPHTKAGPANLVFSLAVDKKPNNNAHQKQTDDDDSMNVSG
eukprot:GHVT01069072.1.p1 GENE.GHVT01069072.1~~GHVT01069072.1.p1  ORF type:complete len:144 (-),score=8.82 GHVT01069072.1:421-852(-)